MSVPERRARSTEPARSVTTRARSPETCFRRCRWRPPGAAASWATASRNTYWVGRCLSANKESQRHFPLRLRWGAWRLLPKKSEPVVLLLCAGACKRTPCMWINMHWMQEMTSLPTSPSNHWTRPSPTSERQASARNPIRSMRIIVQRPATAGSIG